jgi:hypothetical protein
MEVGVARWKYVGIRVEDKSNTNNCIRDLGKIFPIPQQLTFYPNN